MDATGSWSPSSGPEHTHCDTSILLSLWTPNPVAVISSRAAEQSGEMEPRRALAPPMAVQPGSTTGMPAWHRGRRGDPETDGSVSAGPARFVSATLAPMELVVLGAAHHVPRGGPGVQRVTSRFPIQSNRFASVGKRLPIDTHGDAAQGRGIDVRSERRDRRELRVDRLRSESAGSPAHRREQWRHGRRVIQPLHVGQHLLAGDLGAHEVHGLIHAGYQIIGYDGSCLGLPTSDEVDSAAGAVSNFEHGTIRMGARGVLGHGVLRRKSATDHRRSLRYSVPSLQSPQAGIE